MKVLLTGGKGMLGRTLVRELGGDFEVIPTDLPEADIASMAPGDAVLLPEVGSVPPRLVVNGCFAVDVNGVAPLAENSNSLLRVRAAEGRSISLGEVFDASETPPQLPPVAVGTQLVLLGEGRTVASGRLDRLAGQYAFFVEKTI